MTVAALEVVVAMEVASMLENDEEGVVAVGWGTATLVAALFTGAVLTTAASDNALVAFKGNDAVAIEGRIGSLADIISVLASAVVVSVVVEAGGAEASAKDTGSC